MVKGEKSERSGEKFKLIIFIGFQLMVSNLIREYFNKAFSINGCCFSCFLS